MSQYYEEIVCSISGWNKNFRKNQQGHYSKSYSYKSIKVKEGGVQCNH